MSRGLILAAPSSRSGKTTVTLGLLRALSDRGHDVRGGKSGPDYIDPKFHEAACGMTCFNLDAWAMSGVRIRDLAGRGDGFVLIEGAMGLFDGAPPDGQGSVADLARMLDLPVVLVVDAASMAQSVAPLVAGFAGFDPDVRIAGVILNRVGSERHAAMLGRALASVGVPVLGCVARDPKLAMPERHLGLVQAQERPDLDAFLSHAGATMADAIDLDRLMDLARPIKTTPSGVHVSPPAQRIAVAQDAAFAFAYPHLLEDWRAAGADISTFSPLADEAPSAEADLVYLPGGYPELHAGRLASNHRFMQALREAGARRQVYGECGGYMVLGDGLVDADGTRHKMAGLLRLETSFARRKLHLGYRHAEAATGPFQGHWRAHEFHYASTLKAEGTPLFSVADAENAPLGDAGLTAGRVSGSFLHLIDRD